MKQSKLKVTRCLNVGHDVYVTMRGHWIDERADVMGIWHCFH